MMLPLCLLTLFLILAPSVIAVAAAQDRLVGVASVIDGNTIEIHGQRIRLHGIDAPESGQHCMAAGRRWRYGQLAALARAIVHATPGGVTKVAHPNLL